MGMHYLRSHAAQHPPQGKEGPLIQHRIDLAHERWYLEHRRAGLAKLLQIGFQQHGIVCGHCVWPSNRETDTEPTPIMPQHRLDSLTRRPSVIESCDDMNHLVRG